MPNITITKRQIHNTVSGIDMTIPAFSERSANVFSKSVDCSVVVVTQLACYKSPEHSDEDVIQFMVSKKVEDFEDFRQKLATAFPGTVLPPVPKSLFSFTEGSTKQQLSLLSKFLQFVASTPKIATSVQMITFLGFTSAQQRSARKDVGKNPAASSSLFDYVDSPADDRDDLFGGGEPEEQPPEDLDLFTASTTAKHSQSINAAPRLFADQDLGGRVSTHDPLVSLPGATDVPHTHQGELVSHSDDDDEDLLRIDDDLDKILNLDTKPCSKSKPAKPSKPVVSKKPGVPAKPSLPEKPRVSEKPKSSAIQEDEPGSLGADDILSYIQENTSSNMEDLDLFS